MNLLLLQVTGAEPARGGLDRLIELMRTPVPDVSLWMVVGLMVVLFLLFRTRNQRVDLGLQAQEVLRDRFAKGEISEETYYRLMADVRLRPRR